MDKQYLGMGSLGGRADFQQMPDFAQTAERLVTPGERLARAVERLQMACGEVAGLRERLCGSQPANDAAKGLSVAPGFFGGIEACSNQIDAVVSSILEDVKTINSRL